jgi:hypothetical protein
VKMGAGRYRIRSIANVNLKARVGWKGEDSKRESGNYRTCGGRSWVPVNKPIEEVEGEAATRDEGKGNISDCNCAFSHMMEYVTLVLCPSLPLPPTAPNTLGVSHPRCGVTTHDIDAFAARGSGD